MATLSRPKQHAASTRCKKHPNHNHSPGVCSLCLTQRLTQLLASTSGSRVAKMAYSSSCSSISSYYSSSSASSSSSPYVHPRLSGRKISSISMSSLFKRRTNFFTATKSLNGGGDPKQKKSDGFWSKLMMSRRGKEIVEETLRRSISTTDQKIENKS